MVVLSIIMPMAQHAQEVIIDTLTGEYKLLRVDILHDVGASINPAIDIGQIEGGFIQGVGWLTSEELCWDGQGRLTTSGPASYKIPAISDMPLEFNTQLLQNHANSEDTVHHSKAVGEPMLAIQKPLLMVGPAPQLNTPQRLSGC